MEDMQSEIIDAATAALAFMDGVESVDTKTLPGGPEEGRMFTITNTDGRKSHFELRWIHGEKKETLD